jgi:5-methylthioadenosine/S-adenosylhomocysteine deaminase
MGMCDEIGSLAVGKKADLIQIELERPHLQPFYAEPASIAYYVRACDVVNSVIDGRVVMADGVVAGLDEPSIVARVKAHIPHWLRLMRSHGGVGTFPGCPCS